MSKLGAYAPEPAGLDFIGQVGESLLYSPVGAYQAVKAAEQDVGDAIRGRDRSFGRTREMGKQMGKAIYEDVRHPQENAGYLAMDILGAAGGVAGTAGRLGSAGRALRQAGRHAPGIRLQGIRVAADASDAECAQAVGDALHEHLKSGKPVDPSLLDHHAEIAKLHVGGTTSRARAAARGFTRPKSRGFEQLLHYDRGVFGGKITEEELVRMDGEIREALDLGETKVTRRERYRQERQEAKEAFRAKGGVEKGFALVGEVSAALRAAILYLRPAYLPNNWAGNELLNLVHQGFLAPVNLAKSMVIHRKLGRKRSRAVDAAMGHSATEAALGASRFKASVSPGIHFMSAAADTPFRRAAFLHEARRAGYRKLSQVRSLIDAAERSPARMRELSEIALKANEEIVKFGKLTESEKLYLRPYFFIYSWTRAATRYAGRFPIKHPIQLAAQVQLGRQGREYVAEMLGDTPNWLRGYIPVGIDAEGNPILVNPTNMTPLGTGLQTAAALVDSVKLILGKDADTKGIADLLHPMIDVFGIGPHLEHTPSKEGLERRLPQWGQYQEFMHPGEGKTFPGTRREAVGRFVAGSAYPRVADAEELHNQALAKYPAPIANYYKELRQAEEASKELGIPFRPIDRQELGWDRDLETALDEADIATGDYGHRLRILVDEYVKRNPKAGDLRQWAQQLSAPEYHKEAQSAYLKLRKEYTPNWNSYYEQVVKTYEEELLRQEALAKAG